jgi:homocitrate synthase NifV
MLKNYSITEKQLLLFCDLMKKIGIIDLEISKNAYETMAILPEGIRFYLYLEPYEQASRYPGIHRFIVRQETNIENGISEFQMNDIRELVKLKNLRKVSFIRIVGLDDLMLTNYEQVMSDIMRQLKNSQINFCPENEFGCASALASMWVLRGGSEITTSFAHYGNRAATEEVLMTLRIAARYKPNQDFTSFPEIKRLLEEITNIPMALNKPLLGNEIFYVESGVHVDGILKNPANYEAYVPKIVGLDTKIVIGKHSGRSSVIQKLKENGIQLAEESLIEEILERVKLRSLDMRGSLTDEEFLSLAKEVMSSERKKMDC